MDLLFDRRFLYNWTVNPDKPGLADFFVFSLKLTLIFVVTMMMLGNFRHVGIIGFLLSPFIEEQARITWLRNANSPLRAGLLFASFIAVFELITTARDSQGFVSIAAFIDICAIRIAPTAAHFIYTILGYRMLQRGISAVRAWFACVAVHLFFNEVLATRVGGWMESLQLGSRLL
jgi:hypothetical protein